MFGVSAFSHHQKRNISHTAFFNDAIKLEVNGKAVLAKKYRPDSQDFRPAGAEFRYIPPPFRYLAGWRL
jgi:hypothetical protein